MRGTLAAFAAVLVGMLLVGGSFRSVRAAQDDGSVTVQMEEYDGSGISGTAILTDSPDGVVVEISLEGNIEGSHPAHFHEGTCDTMDPLVPIYPLADVDADGTSVTTVPDVSLADVTTEPFVINVHKSLAELPVIVSCGNVPVAGEDEDGAAAEDEEGTAIGTPVAEGVGGGTPGQVPAAGVGSAIGMDDSNSAVLVTLGLLAVALAVAGFSLRRLEDRTNTGGDAAV
jgi:hypothetical protein